MSEINVDLLIECYCLTEVNAHILKYTEVDGIGREHQYSRYDNDHHLCTSHTGRTGSDS
jgi:hypothetical protein